MYDKDIDNCRIHCYIYSLHCARSLVPWKTKLCKNCVSGSGTVLKIQLLQNSPLLASLFHPISIFWKVESSSNCKWAPFRLSSEGMLKNTLLTTAVPLMVVHKKLLLLLMRVVDFVQNLISRVIHLKKGRVSWYLTIFKRKFPDGFCIRGCSQTTFTKQDEVGRWSKNVHFLSTYIP